MGDEYFTIPYLTDTMPNSPVGNELPTQANTYVWIISINGEEPIISIGPLDENNLHQTSRGKSKVKISLCRIKSYQKTDIEEIRYIYDQVRPVVSHIEVSLPNKPPTPDNIGEGLKVSQRQLWK